MRIPFITPKKLSSYEILEEKTIDLLQYNIELLKTTNANMAEEIFRLRKENEELTENLRLKQEAILPATSLPQAGSKILPKITSFNELRSRLEQATLRKK